MSEALNDLLDANLDDLADLPEFGVFPAGTHKVTIALEQKEVNGNPCIELSMTAIETEELADPNGTPLKAGDKGSVLYMMNNEFGQGNFKKMAKQVAAITGTSSIRDTIEAAKGLEVSVVTKVRQNKDKTASYTELVKLFA